MCLLLFVTPTPPNNRTRWHRDTCRLLVKTISTTLKAHGLNMGCSDFDAGYAILHGKIHMEYGVEEKESSCPAKAAATEFKSKD